MTQGAGSLGIPKPLAGPRLHRDPGWWTHVPYTRLLARRESESRPRNRTASMVASGSHSGGGVQRLVATQRGEALELSFRRIGWVFSHSSSRGFGTLPPTYYVTAGTWFGLAIEGGSRRGQTIVVTSIA